jgi:hypothetical protein
MQPLLLAPLVMAMRMPVLALEAFRMAHGQSPNPSGRAESERMVSEKIVAARQGVVMATAELARINIEFAITLMGGDPHGAGRVMRRAPARIARAAARPGARRVRRNARRLLGASTD